MPPGQVIRGFNELGEMLCVQDDNTQNFYSGLDFALSDQQCGANKKVVGIDVEGRIVCSNLEDSVYLAGAGLQLDVETFSVTPGGIETAMVADDAITVAKVDTGSVQARLAQDLSRRAVLDRGLRKW